MFTEAEVRALCRMLKFQFNLYKLYFVDLALCMGQCRAGTGPGLLVQVKGYFNAAAYRHILYNCAFKCGKVYF